MAAGVGAGEWQCSQPQAAMTMVLTVKSTNTRLLAVCFPLDTTGREFP